MAKPCRGRPASSSRSRSPRSRSVSGSRSRSYSGSSSRSRSRLRSFSFSSRSGSSRSPSPAPPRKSPAGGVKRGRSPPPQTKRTSPPQRKASPIPESLVLHVDQLSRNVNQNHLKEIFGNFGEVVNVRLAIDHIVNIPKGFAYVEFKNRADAEKAQLYMDGSQIDGKVVRAKFTLPERKKVASPLKAAATTSRRDALTSEDATEDGDKDVPKRQREASPRGRPLSPPRRRSPVARRVSPRRGPGSPPPRRRLDSPVRRRANSPYRRGDSPPLRRRPASTPRGRSPSSPPRRHRSPPRGSPRRIRGSPVRRRSPFPPRRRSPRRARSPPRRSPIGRRRSRFPVRRPARSPSGSPSPSPRRVRGPPVRRGRSSSSSPSPRRYTAEPPHGTTIIWVRLSPKEILVGVDSRHTQIFTADEENNRRKAYDVLWFDDDLKFVRVCGVYATLCGSAEKCNGMIEYIKTEVKKRGLEESFSNVGDLGIEFLKKHPIEDPTKEHVSMVYFCAWMPDKQQYDVVLVKDGLQVPDPVTVDVFGCGSGSGPGLFNLERDESRRNVDGLFQEMINAVANDPCTGGLIRVYRLPEDGTNTIEAPVCAITFTDMLSGPDANFYEPMVFNEKTMFVIIWKENQHILSRMDVVSSLNLGYRDATWFGYTDNLMLYLVEFPSSNRRFDFLPTGHPEEFRTFRFNNGAGQSCECIFGCGSRAIWDRAKAFNGTDNLSGF